MFNKIKPKTVNNNRNISEQELELIDRYLRKELSETEHVAFEQRLAADAEWREKVQEIKLLSLSIQENALASRLNTFHKAVPISDNNKPKVIKMNWAKRVAIAATLILGVTMLSRLLFFRETGNEKLYATYYKPDPGLATLMGVSDNYEFENAMVDYKTGSYTKALSTWLNMLKENPDNDTLDYFIASAYLAKDDVPEASVYFEKVIRRQQSVFLQDAKWYKALLLLKQGKKEEAVALLQATEHPDRDALLRKLEE